MTICCRRCGETLCLDQEAILVDGKDEQSFENPAGYRYRLRFVAEAPGCVAVGEASHEASWFPGYTWQRSYCRSCSELAGWLFRSKTRIFTGLIVDAQD